MCVDREKLHNSIVGLVLRAGEDADKTWMAIGDDDAEAIVARQLASGAFGQVPTIKFTDVVVALAGVLTDAPPSQIDQAAKEVWLLYNETNEQKAALKVKV